MALNITGYVDPGSYVGEVVVPGGVTVATVPLTVTLVGVASRNKRANNEALTRGLISNEALTVASSPPHTATLVNVGNRQTAQTTITKDGLALDSSQFSFNAATITGATNVNLDFTTNNKFSLALDGLRAVTIAITGSGGDLTTITGDLITQRLGSIGGGIATTTMAQVAEGINKALAGATSLGYGPSYGAVASAAANKVTLTSPLTTPVSDVRLYVAYPTAQSQTAAIFGVSLPYQAPTVLTIANGSYSGTSAYVANYVSTNSNIDVLANANVQSVIKVGSYANVTSFKTGTDFNLSGQNLDWSILTAASFASSISATTFDVSTNDTILLSLDGKAAVTIDLNGLGSPPPGYANPSSPAAATPAELVNNINAILANSTTYGPAYRAVASFTGSGPYLLVLTSPNVGVGSSVQLAAPATLSAVTALYGLSSGQLPYSTSGVGSKPSAGAIYFATYEYTRLNSDYNLPKRYFSPDALYADLGFPKSTNQLAIAAGVAFDNSAPSVLAIQVNDVTFPGFPQPSEILAGINASSTTSSATELCVLTTALASQVDAMNNVVNQNSPTEKNFRRGWFGMARNTPIGDKDTTGSFVAMAVRTLQVPGDSPGRGRLILAAPSNVSRTITQEDGSLVLLPLDGSYLAVAIAARMTAFTSASDTLLRKTVAGFDSASFQTYLRAERALLAGNGVTVVTYNQLAGTMVLLDPMSTEGGNGKLIAFSEISASTQKDAVTTAVNNSLDSNLVGVVPSDLASFITTIKGFLGNTLRSMIANGTIAPFKTKDGVTRDVDFSTDIQVFQDLTDQTKYQFRYTYNLRYPAKRFFGQYSVDNPFQA